MNIVSRQEALVLGLKHYYTGVLCKNGHDAQRYTTCGGCVDCTKDRARKRKELDPEGYRQKCRQACTKWEKSDKGKTYRQTDRERELHRLSAKRRRAKDPAKVQDSNRQQYQKNREAIIAKKKEYWRQNPDIRRAARMSYEARKRNADGRFSASDIEALRFRQSLLCNGCLSDLTATGYHIDHIMPLSLGGSNRPDNLQLLCPTCNHRKHSKHPEEWEKIVRRIRSSN